MSILDHTRKVCFSFIFLNNGKVVMLNPKPDPGILIHGMRNVIQDRPEDNVFTISEDEASDLSSFAVKLGLFKSVTQARKNGWSGIVDPTDKRFEKRKIKVLIQ